MCDLSTEGWRYTWETQSHSPNLKLFLFHSQTRPSRTCVNPNTCLSTSYLIVTWNRNEKSQDNELLVTLKVPLPYVLIDSDATVHSRALDDHIEVKLVLLLPVDHPLVYSVPSSERDDNGCLRDGTPTWKSLSGLQSLSSLEEGVNFNCRNCSSSLTRFPIRKFVELPSVNWQELADNWFGCCCCSYGGASEKLVKNFVNAYSCAKGVCYMSLAAVTLSTSDVIGFDCSEEDDEKPVPIQKQMSQLKLEDHAIKANDEELENPPQISCETTHCGVHSNHSSPLDETNQTSDQKSFRNGFLGDGFISRSQNLSSEIEWKHFTCPSCASFLGLYPCGDNGVNVDNGVRLYKCRISTPDLAEDLFREFHLEKMMSDQLVEKERDELSFRSVIRDINKRSSVVRLVLVNSSSWSCTGWCVEPTEDRKFIVKPSMIPVVKLLFSASTLEREMKDWEEKHRPDVFFMANPLIQELLKSLESSRDLLPPSCTSIQGFSLSSLKR